MNKSFLAGFEKRAQIQRSHFEKRAWFAPMLGMATKAIGKLTGSALFRTAKNVAMPALNYVRKNPLKTLGGGLTAGMITADGNAAAKMTMNGKGVIGQGANAAYNLGRQSV